MLLIFAVLSTAASSASKLASVAEMTSITNVLSGGSESSFLRLSTARAISSIQRREPLQRAKRRGNTLTGRSPGECLPADDEALDVRVPASRAVHVVDGHDVVYDVRPEEREELARACGAHF